MSEILLPACQFPRLSDGATCRDIHAKALCQACTAHVQVAALRTRLENAEVVRRDAQESRLDLIIQNEELGADLAELRARLESVEQALRECDAVLARAQSGEGFPKDSEAWPESIHFWKAVDMARKTVAVALGAAGEENANG